jgi:ribosome assembly protein RRB1
MGKKSKRNRSSKPFTANNNNNNNNNDHDGARRVAPGLRNANNEEETLENLRFEDPYVDEIEAEDYMDDDDEDEDNDKTAGMTELVQSWHPLMLDAHGQPVPSPEALEIDPMAYKMHHALQPEWPSLTFDFLKDELGMGRTRFPHSLQVAVGSQADLPQHNQITIMKLSDLGRLPGSNKNNKEDLDDDDDDDSSSSSDDDDDDDHVDLDPILEHFAIPHYGGVNRLRVMPQQSNILATWSDVGKVNVFNIEHVRARFSSSSVGGSLKPPSSSSSSSSNTKQKDKPYFTHNGHGVEGYAMDWSPVQQGYMCTGDCDGNIHLWTPRPEGGYEVTPSYLVNDYNPNSSTNSNSKTKSKSGSHSSPSHGVEKSVEDLQWSPTEATVFASAECGGMIRIFDTRAPHRAMVHHLVHATTKADVNVLSWNKLVTNLIATGGDDGTLSVWDLRHLATPTTSTSTSTNNPLLARFSPHKTPITSVEWHPTDESMLAVSDAVGAYVYDLSVEEDDTTFTTTTSSTTKVGGEEAGGIIPPQMLFAHAGSQDFKELHWHPQISSCIMTTALTGFSIFIPSNL